MNWFINCKNLEELKKEYKKLIMQHHPDRGGNNETMAQINAEYDKVFEVLQKTSTSKTEQAEKSFEYRDLINQLINLSGITIEICGAWLWISGETKPHKDTLKDLHCFWAPNKKMWYWRAEEAACHHNRNTKSMNQIRNKYGSTIIHSTTHEKLSA